MQLHKQPIGKNVPAKYGVDIAKLLCLENPERYTGHCWRSTSITMLVNKGFTKEQIKRHTGDHLIQIISSHTLLQATSPTLFLKVTFETVLQQSCRSQKLWRPGSLKQFRQQKINFSCQINQQTYYHLKNSQRVKLNNKMTTVFILQMEEHTKGQYASIFLSRMSQLQ
jgi:hypothetical protein